MTFDASKKLCIVVGLGKGGIGDALAHKFSQEGYNVAMVARSNLEHLETQIANSKSYQCDAGDPLQVHECVKMSQKDMGTEKIDALMYNAGSGVFKPFEETTYEDLMLSLKVGPAGIFLWTKACLPKMESGSSIGLTGATASWRGMPYTPGFAPSKMATRGLAQALARDLGPNRGIHVFHVIIDGLVDLSAGAVGEGQQTMYEEKRANNELLEPAQIAETYWQLHCQPPTCWTQETHVAAQGAFGSIASI